MRRIYRRRHKLKTTFQKCAENYTKWQCKCFQRTLKVEEHVWTRLIFYFNGCQRQFRNETTRWRVIYRVCVTWVPTLPHLVWRRAAGPESIQSNGRRPQQRNLSPHSYRSKYWTHATDIPNILILKMAIIWERKLTSESCLWLSDTLSPDLATHLFSPGADPSVWVHCRAPDVTRQPDKESSTGIYMWKHSAHKSSKQVWRDLQVTTPTNIS